MEIRSLKKGIELLGYANVPEKLSKVLRDRRGQFVERIEEGAFKRSLDANPNIPMLLNHDKSKIIADGQNLQIIEDKIGLKVRALITDNDVIRALKEHKESGFSFGFYAKDQDYSTRDDGMEVRTIKDLILTEVSLLIGKIPAYNHTSVIEVRDDEEQLVEYRCVDDVTLDILIEEEEEKRDTVSLEQIEMYRQFVEVEKLKFRGM